MKRADKPPPAAPQAAPRQQAEHVRRVVAAHVQAKPQAAPPSVRQPAPHVQAALSAAQPPRSPGAAQPKMAAASVAGRRSAPAAAQVRPPAVFRPSPGRSSGPVAQMAEREGRRRRQSFASVQQRIVDGWVTAQTAARRRFVTDATIGGQGEGSCGATLIDQDFEEAAGAYDGASGLHAEMSALQNYVARGGSLDKIVMIRITSAPCPRCAALLGLLGIANTVVHRPSDSREAAGWQFPNLPGVNWGTVLGLRADEDVNLDEIKAHFKTNRWW